LQLQRAPAKQKSNKTKSILLNFGGPGADGIEDFAYFARRMQAYVMAPVVVRYCGSWLTPRTSATGDGHHLINLVPRYALP
jgi:hypothetical protein